MKFKVEINIDWISEDGCIDDAISDEIKADLCNKIYIQVAESTKKIVKDLTAVANQILDKKIMETYDEFLSKPFVEYDKWGEKIREKVSIKEMLKEKLDNFMSETVSYGGSRRYEKILNEQAIGQIDTFIRNLSKVVISGIANDINKEAVKRVSTAILSDYNLKKLINPIA